MFFKSSDFDFDIITVVEMEWQRVNAHAGKRPFHALTFRLIGDATFQSEGAEDLSVLEGEIVFGPENKDFKKIAEHGKIIAVHFKATAPLPDKILRFSPRNSQFFKKQFIKLHSVWQKKELGFEHEAKMLLYKIVLEIEREWAKITTASSNERLAESLAYIHEHFKERELSVDLLSRRAGMSDTYLRALFIAEFGKTPKKYISDLRLEAAKELLQSGYYTVNEISDLLGFNNVNYFSFFIKKQTGLPPLEYKKRLLKMD